MTELYRKRFDDLVAEAKRVLAKTHMSHERQFGPTGPFVDNDALGAWRLKAEHLLEQVAGVDSRHLTSFHNARVVTIGSTNHSALGRQLALFLAAQEDYLGGHLRSQRSLVSAELFVDGIEQAEELERNGYHVAAAVIAGTVMETAMRELCKSTGIAVGKLDRMNAELAKACKYGAVVAKRITWLAGVRNAAAHGDAERFNVDDVAPMIAEISRLLPSLSTD